MQLKLYIPSLQQEYVYHGGVQDMKFHQLLQFVTDKLKINSENPEFTFHHNNETIQFGDEDNFEKVKTIALNHQLPALELKLVELFTPQEAQHMITCQACKCYPIMGIRYKCFVCKNLDFCSKCYSIHKHPFIMITDPLQEVKKPSLIGELGKKICQSLSNSGKSTFGRFQIYLKEKRALYIAEKERRAYIQELSIREKLLKLPMLQQENPEKYQELVKKGQNMKLKDIAKMIE